MLPYIKTGSLVFESYTLITNMGTLIGMFASYQVLEKYCSMEKRYWKVLLLLLALMASGDIPARFLKGLFHGSGMGTATHFLGRVLFAALLLPILLSLMWKECSCMKQAMNASALYFLIQHFFNRIACWMNGCCNGILIESLHVRFPSQFFEAGMMLLVLILLGKNIRKGDSFFGQSMLIYAMVIFVSENFIDQPEVPRVFMLTSVQTGALLLSFLAVWYIRKSKY